MPRAEYVWFCECCGAEHREEMLQDADGNHMEPSAAYRAGWREVGNGERLVECCPACFKDGWWKIAGVNFKREQLILESDPMTDPVRPEKRRTTKSL